MAPNIQRALLVRKQFITFLDDLEEFVANKIKTATQPQVNLYLEDLFKRYKHFLSSQTDIEDNDVTEFDSTIRVDVDKKYYALRPALEQRLLDIKESKRAVNAPRDVEPLTFTPKLPELILETFTGDITKWTSFIESFNSHVHNNPKLSNITKFQYLRNSIKGLGAKPFESLDFTSENYEEARRLLIERFNRPNYICEEHIRALFSFKSLDKPNPSRLLELLD